MGIHTLSHIKIIFSLSCCFFYISVFASDGLNKRVTLQMEDVPLSKVFVAITKQSELRFSYSPQRIDVNRKITCNIQNREIKFVLDTILPSSIEYKLMGKYIVLSPTKKIFFNSGRSTDDNLDNVIFKKEEDMKQYLAALLITAPIVTNSIMAQIDPNNLPDNLPDISMPKIRNKKMMQATFIFPIGSDGSHSAQNEYNISVNLLGGITGSIKGVEFGGIFNANQYSAQGIQLAGIFNTTGFSFTEEKSSNVQIAGIFNYTRLGYSTQIAGFANIGDNATVQFSSIANISAGSLFQIGGVVNLTGRNVFQLGGIANFATESRFQVAGIVNVTKKGQFQLSGITNIAQESSFQLGGIANITKKGGLQIGLVNVRDTDDGISFGLVNIVKRGGVLDYGVEGGEFIQTALTFRSGVKKLYTFLGLGYNFSDNFWAAGAGLGTTVSFPKKFSLDVEALQYQLFKNFKKPYQYNGLLQLRPIINYSIITNRFGIYLGPSLNLLILHQDNKLDCKTPYDFYNRKVNNRILSSWVGVVGGMKF